MSIVVWENKEVVRMKRVLPISMLILGFCFLGVFAFAQQRGGVPDQLRPLLIIETLPEDERIELFNLQRENPEKFREVAKDVIQQRVKELGQIKEENPEEFREIMTVAQQRLREDAEKFQQNHPQKFEKAREKLGMDAQGVTQEQLKNLKKAQQAKIHMAVVFATLPTEEQEVILHLRKEYQQVLKKALKRRGEELKRIKEENPEKFKEIVQEARQKVATSLKKGHKKNPQKFEKLKRVKPEYLKEKLQWLKEEDPELYEELIEKMKEKRSQGQNHREHGTTGLDYEVIFSEDIPLAE